MRWIPRTNDPVVKDLRRMRDLDNSLAALARVTRIAVAPGRVMPVAN